MTAPKPAPKPTAKSSVSKNVEENGTTAECRTSSVFVSCAKPLCNLIVNLQVETETGQTRVEDFDLDSLLYDIVKFDPSKVVQQQQQQQTQPQQMPLPVANNVQQDDIPDSGVPEQQSPQDGNI